MEEIFSRKPFSYILQPFEFLFFLGLERKRLVGRNDFLNFFLNVYSLVDKFYF